MGKDIDIQVKEVTEILQENQYDTTQLSPEQIKLLKEYAPAILDMATKLSESNMKSQSRFYDTNDKAIDAFKEQLSNPDLSYEVRKDLNDRIERRTDKAFKKDTEHKGWLLAVIATALGGGTLALKNEKVQEIAKEAIKSIAKK